MELKLVNALNDRKWCDRLLRMTWYCIALVALVEFVIFGFKRMTGGAVDAGAYIRSYILFPALLHAAILGIVHSISYYLVGKHAFTKQAFVYLTGVSIICASIAWTHHAVKASQLVFGLPILISLVYIGRRPLRYAFFLNLGFYIAYAVALSIWIPASALGFMEVCTSVAILVVEGLTGYLILGRQMELVQSTIDANRLSMMDSLTKLYNHAAFYEQLDEHIMKQAHGEGDFCLIVFDIDDFKKINDRYGHDVGDEVLLALVSAVKASIGRADAAFRYGGEEFTVLTPRDAHQTLALAEAIRASFASRSLTMERPIEATVSAGVCRFDPDIYSGRREFFASADEALYEAKRTGKDKAILWSEKLLERPDRLEIIEQEKGKSVG